MNVDIEAKLARLMAQANRVARRIWALDADLREEILRQAAADARAIVPAGFDFAPVEELVRHAIETQLALLDGQAGHA